MDIGIITMDIIDILEIGSNSFGLPNVQIMVFTFCNILVDEINRNKREYSMKLNF